MSRRFSKQVLASINQRLDITQLVSKHVQLKSTGNRLVGLCPFHNEKTPSFTVTPEKNLYYCFGCQAHGSPLDFYLKINQLSFLDGVKQLCDELGIHVDDDWGNDLNRFNKVADWCHEELSKQTAISKQLISRGIGQKNITYFNLGFMPNIQAKTLAKALKCTIKELIEIGIINPETQRNRFSQRIIFPITDYYGQIVGFGGRRIREDQVPKYINSPETKYFKKNQIVYGIDKAKSTDTIILVEGYMDVIKLYEHDICGAVAFMGTSFNSEQILNLTKRYRTIYICYDGDQAGKNATDKITQACLKLLGPNCEIKVIRLPSEHDPDSFIDSLGKEEFKKLMDNSVSISVDVINQLLEKNPADSTIGKSRFKQSFMQMSEEIKDSIFRKEFKDLGYERIYNQKVAMKKTAIINEAGQIWQERIAYLISSKPEYCHDLPKDDIQTLINLKNESDSRLSFIGHMVFIIVEYRILSINQLIEHAKKQATRDKLLEFKNKKSYLTKENHILELKSSIPKLHKELNRQRQNKLVAKAKHEKLTRDERTELINLIKKNQSKESII